MPKLTRQIIEFSFYDFCARTLSHAVFESFACDVKPTTIEQQHLIMTSSTEYRKNKWA